MLQGDVHRLYRKLRRCHPTAGGPIPDLDQVREIAAYYASLDPGDRQLLLAWARKEESGIGLIPASLSGVPLLGFIFAPFVQESMRRLAPWAWTLSWVVGATAFVGGIYIHHRQRAYTTLHIQLLDRCCDVAGKPGTEKKGGG